MYWQSTVEQILEVKKKKKIDNGERMHFGDEL